MNNKTCGECKYYNIAMFHCEKFACYAGKKEHCENFEPKNPPTNGDKIRQMSNEELVMLLAGDCCKHCIYRVANSKGRTVTCRCIEQIRIPNCDAGTLAWLNAPAESEGKDE